MDKKLGNLYEVVVSVKKTVSFKQHNVRRMHSPNSQCQRYEATSLAGVDYSKMLHARHKRAAFDADKYITFNIDDEKDDDGRYKKVNYIFKHEAVTKGYKDLPTADKLEDEVKKEKHISAAYNEATESLSRKNNELKVDDTTWKILSRNVLVNRNTLLTGPSGCGKSSIALEVAKSLNRQSYIFNFGSTQDPRSSLIGQNQYNKERGTFFVESDFIKALETPDCVIVLDELSRAHPEAFNIIFPLLDFRHSMRIDETNRNVNIADGVSFVATANIGIEYTSTRTIDRALMDRFIPLEINFISKEDELNLIKSKFPKLNDIDAANIVDFVDLIRKELTTESPKINNHISTRTVIELASMVEDGFDLYDAVKYTILPAYDSDGGTDSERTFVLQILQKFVCKNNDNDK